MTEQYSSETINGTIDRLLADRRPDRYEHGLSDGWLDDLADSEIAPILPEAQVRRFHARTLVRNREGSKTQRTNRLLRDIYESGQLPLDWLDTLDWPLAVGKERVALRAAGPDDFEQHAIEERRAAARDFSARNAAAEGSEWMAQQMRANGWQFGADIRPTESDGGEG